MIGVERRSALLKPTGPLLRFPVVRAGVPILIVSTAFLSAEVREFVSLPREHQRGSKGGRSKPHQQNPPDQEAAHSTYQKVVQGQCPVHYFFIMGPFALFSNTSALTNSLLFMANSRCKGSRTPRLVEHFWVPILGASCSNKLFVGTLRLPHQRKQFPIPLTSVRLPPAPTNITSSFLFVELALLGLPEKLVTWLPEIISGELCP